jgi:RNA polymerase sigma-70 factor (ECF subfamily)
VQTFCFDEGYITRLQNRDAEAEAHLVAHFKMPIWLKARRELHATDLADDACQETLLRVLRYFRSGKSLENPQSLPGFVYSICHNVAMEMIRFKIRNRQFPETGHDQTDTSIDTEMELVTEERKRLVMEILEQLPEKDRDLLRLVMVEELDRPEICRRFQVSEDYLRVLLHRARLRFRTALVTSGASRELGFGQSMK